MSTSRRRTVGDHAPAVEQDHPVGVLRGERQVVHRRHAASDPTSWRSSSSELERLLLVADVERRGRLVEQDQRRLLRERAGHDGALALAAAERPEEPVVRSPTRSSRSSARSAAATSCRALLREVPEVRRSPEQHVFATRSSTAAWRDPAARRRPGGRARAAAARDVSPSEERDRARRSGTSPATARSSVVLPAPFGPITTTHSPSANGRDHAGRRPVAPPSATETPSRRAAAAVIRPSFGSYAG